MNFTLRVNYTKLERLWIGNGKDILVPFKEQALDGKGKLFNTFIWMKTNRLVASSKLNQF
jgi:hypothetical protein